MQVSVIVMMTKLVENTKRKAHQYWPESSGDEPSRQKLEIGGGCSVEHLSTSFQGTYFNRQATSFEENKAIKDGGSTAGLPPNNKQKDHQ